MVSVLRTVQSQFVHWQYNLKIYRMPVLAILLAILSPGAVSPVVERIDAATLVHEAFHLGPIRSFVVQQDG